MVAAVVVDMADNALREQAIKSHLMMKTKAVGMTVEVSRVLIQHSYSLNLQVIILC
jgi:hypothetical protein